MATAMTYIAFALAPAQGFLQHLSIATAYTSLILLASVLTSLADHVRAIHQGPLRIAGSPFGGDEAVDLVVEIRRSQLPARHQSFFDNLGVDDESTNPPGAAGQLPRHVPEDASAHAAHRQEIGRLRERPPSGRAGSTFQPSARRSSAGYPASSPRA